MPIDKNMNVLIVDDNKTMLHLIRSLLVRMSFSNIEQATDGKMALDKMKEKSFGLILSDWNMGPMTGLDFLKEVRVGNKTVPFIMLTAESKPDNIIVAKQAGVNNYIVKPFTEETLKSKIENVLGAA